jgi:hypothetical protein
MIVMSVVTLGLLLWYAADSGRVSGRSLLVALGLLVLFTAMLSTFGGNTYWTNQHMTHTEYQGAEFVLEYHEPGEPVYSHALYDKMEWFVYGNTSRFGEGPFGREYRVPDRLGYADNESAAVTFGGGYVVTQAYDRKHHRAEYYTEEQKEHLFVYDQSSLDRLARDPTAQKLYESGEFEGWYVRNATARNATV